MAHGSAASILAAANARTGAVKGNRGTARAPPGALARSRAWGTCTTLSWLCLGYIIGVCVTMLMSFKAYTPAWSDRTMGRQRILHPRTLSEHRKGMASQTSAVRQEAAQNIVTTVDGGSDGVAHVAAAPGSMAVLESAEGTDDRGAQGEEAQGSEAALQTHSHDGDTTSSLPEASTANFPAPAPAEQMRTGTLPPAGSAKEEAKQDGFDADVVKEEAAMMSKLAYEGTIAKYPEVDFDPPYGPVSEFVPAKRDGDMIPNKYHVLAVGDCQAYQGWQFLANYHGYQKMKKEYPDSPMGGYTRLIHCDEPDSLMHLVPSFRVNALPWEVTKGYAPKQRSWALVQWLMRYPVREEYILSIDPDTLFMVPPPLLATPDTIFAYPYHYIDCTNKDVKSTCEDPRFNPNGAPADKVPPIGGAPLIISTEMMLEAAPLWDDIMRTMHADEETAALMNWVLDMYAFSLAVAKPDVMSVKLSRCLMVHPPWDHDVVITADNIRDDDNCRMGDEQDVTVPIIHYTHGLALAEDGHAVSMEDAFWSWDKRRHMAHYPKVPFDPPPEDGPETIKQIVLRINEAAASPEFAAFWRANTDLGEE